MSESRKSDEFLQSKIVSVIILISGFVLMWVGSSEFRIFQSEIAGYVSARPDDQTIWLLIIGLAATIAGMVGLLRERSI